MRSLPLYTGADAEVGIIIVGQLSSITFVKTTGFIQLRAAMTDQINTSEPSLMR